MRRGSWKVLTIGTALALATAVPAAAAGDEDNQANREADRPHVTTEVDGNDVQLDFVNPTDFTWSFDYRVDGEPEGTEDEWTGTEISEGPLAGQDFGVRYETVTFEGAGSETVTVTAEEQVEVRLARGAEQNWYFDWITIEGEESPEEEAPLTKQDCKRGGWQEARFRNQGLCIASVVASPRSAH